MGSVNLSSDSLVTLGLVVALSAVLVWYYRRLVKQYSQLPSPNPFFSFLFFLRFYLMGNAQANIPLTCYVLQFLAGTAKVFEKEGIFTAWIGKPHLFVYSPDAVKFFINETAAAEKATLYDQMKIVLGTGLVTSTNDIAERHRKIINPTFRRRLYKSYMSVFNRRSSQLVHDLMREAEKPWIDIAHLVKSWNFSVLCETILGLDEASVVSGTSVEAYFEAADELADFVVARFSRPWLHYGILHPFSSEVRKHMKKADDMRSFSRQVVENFLASYEASVGNSSEAEDAEFVSAKFKPLIRSFVEAHLKDPHAFTLEDIEYELSTFLAAGNHTTSAAVISIIHLLGLHPDVQERAFEEIESTVEGDPTYEDVENLTYLESVIKETLRILPTIPIFGRRLSKEVKYGKYTVPEGTEIIFFPYALHRNSENFPNPDKFDPDRFSPDNMGLYSRYSYVPFAEGTRSCIGRNFAMIEMKVLMTHILRNFRIVSLDPLDKINFKWNIIMRNIETIRIQLIPRNCIRI